MVPVPSRRCLSAVLSVDMAGFPAGSIEVWSGPLAAANGSSVLVLSNREAANATTVHVAAPLSLLAEGYNGFYPFAVLPERSAKASGYAYTVSSELAGGRWVGRS
jgi:hypothetical protein